MVASDASPAVLRLAQRICEDYVGVAVETARIVPQITSS
jgi:hypothetical protein